MDLPYTRPVSVAGSTAVTSGRRLRDRLSSMESATLTRPRPGRKTLATRVRAVPWPRLALGLLALVVAALAVVYPTFPNYDSYYSLVWGRELLHGQALSFDTYRAPTQHPLAIAFGALLVPLGRDADHVLVYATLASFVVLAAGLYRLGRASFTAVVGLCAAALVCTRFDFPFLALRAYIDIPYLALVVWAAALEADKPRRGTPVLVLLTLAGLLRPEVWLLSGLYWLYLFPREPWRLRVRHAALVAAAPLIWCTVDWLVTGDPLFSQHHTSGLAEELGRQRTLGEVPSATYYFLLGLTKAPVFWAGVLGIGLAVYLVPTRTRVPFALLVIGLGTFGVIGLAGLSIIDRYLLVPSMMVMVFAAVTVGGWTMLRPGSRLRVAWAAVAVVAVAYGVVFTAVRVNFASFDRELVFRGDSHEALVRLLDDPRVRAARRCGPVTTPNHKLVPEVRWVLGADAQVGDVLPRSAKGTDARARRGVAILVTDRTALLRQALVQDYDDPLTSVPPPGFTPIARTGYYAAYGRC